MQRESSDAADVGAVEDTLARFAAGLTIDDIGGETTAAFDRLAFDFISVVLAGLRDPVCLRAADAFGGISDGRANAAATAFALGTCAHWFDWDDTDDVSHVHAGAVILPALFAFCASWRERCDAGQFVAATVTGYEIACRVGGHLKNHGHRGWMPTGSGAAVGAAAALAKLAGGGAKEIMSAMGIAAASAGISREALADRTNAKGVLAGIAAKTAGDALTLSRSGVEGPPRFFNGPYGLCALQASGVPADDRVIATIGQKFLIGRVSVKPYPCCRSAHAVIDAALGFRQDLPKIANRVTGMDIWAPPGVLERCGSPFRIGGNARLSAQFSIPYTASVALRKGAIGLEEFEENRILQNTREMQGLIDSVRVKLAPESKADNLTPARTLFMSGNAIIEERMVEVLKGDPAKPLDPEEQSAKLRSAANGLLNESQIFELENLVRDLRHDGPDHLVGWLCTVLASRARPDRR